MMRALIWIVEETWQATVAAAAAFLPAATDITLLHVRAADTETIARAARDALLGRPRWPATDSLDAISEQGAHQLLAEAQTALGREATPDARSDRIEHEMVAAAGTVDLLVLARDEDRAHRGSRSLGHTARYVVDRAPCAMLLVWPDASPG